MMPSKKTINLICLIFFLGNFEISYADPKILAKDRLMSCDSAIALSAAYEILHDSKSLEEPLELFAPAMALYSNGKKEDAVFWYYIAQLRSQNQLAYENGDRGQLIMVMSMTTGALINNYAFQDVGKLNTILNHVLEWDKKSPNPQLKKAVLAESKIGLGYKFIEATKAKLNTNKLELEEQAHKNLPMYNNLLESKHKELCRTGQPDPALVPQMIKSEWAQIMDFVKTNDQIINEVGQVNSVSQVASTKKADALLPIRYEVGVSGVSSTYVIVGVARENGNAKFSIVCTTKISMGGRDPTKDVCSQ